MKAQVKHFLEDPTACTHVVGLISVICTSMQNQNNRTHSNVKMEGSVKILSCVSLILIVQACDMHSLNHTDEATQFNTSAYNLECVPAGFIRGDANNDGVVDDLDPLFIQDYLFLGGTVPDYLDAADANDDGSANVADVIYLLAWLELGLNAPPAPFPLPGTDDTLDTLPSGRFCDPELKAIPCTEAEFIRGDANFDSLVNIKDLDYLNELFSTGSVPLPLLADSADVNDDGAIDISDLIYLNAYLMGFPSSPPPLNPYPSPGLDPTPDGLGPFCKLVDECAKGLDNCSANAQCVDADIAFTCNCLLGYTGSGQVCDDIDECADNNGSCAEICVNEPGGFHCEDFPPPNWKELK
jgi:hypothetical protein